MALGKEMNGRSSAGNSKGSTSLKRLNASLDIFPKSSDLMTYIFRETQTHSLSIPKTGHWKRSAVGLTSWRMFGQEAEHIWPLIVIIVLWLRAIFLDIGTVATDNQCESGVPILHAEFLHTLNGHLLASEEVCKDNANAICRFNKYTILFTSQEYKSKSQKDRNQESCQ